MHLTPSIQSWLNYGRELINFKYPQWNESNHNTEEAREEVWSFYLYWLSKFVDLFDTIFFVLRKKHNQVSVVGWVTDESDT